jgi:hypothetical protein
VDTNLDQVLVRGQPELTSEAAAHLLAAGPRDQGELFERQILGVPIVEQLPDMPQLVRPRPPGTRLLGETP